MQSTDYLKNGKAFYPCGKPAMPLMSAGASVAVVPATLCRFEPFVVIAVKLFHFVKLAAFHHDAQLFKAFRAFHPKQECPAAYRAQAMPLRASCHAIQ